MNLICGNLAFETI